jgi:hypothetical protein
MGPRAIRFPLLFAQRSKSAKAVVVIVDVHRLDVFALQFRFAPALLFVSGGSFSGKVVSGLGPRNAGKKILTFFLGPKVRWSVSESPTLRRSRTKQEKTENWKKVVEVSNSDNICNLKRNVEEN